MKNYTRPILLSLLPSIILGGFLHFLIAMLGGMQNIANTSIIYFFLGVALFIYLLAFKNEGKSIFRKMMVYLSYEFWGLPLSALIYMIASAGQASGARAAGATIGGFFILIICAIVGAFGGIICSKIGHAKDNK